MNRKLLYLVILLIPAIWLFVPSNSEAQVMVSNTCISGPSVSPRGLQFYYHDPNADAVSIIMSTDGFQNEHQLSEVYQGCWHILFSKTNPDNQFDPQLIFYRFKVDGLYQVHTEIPCQTRDMNTIKSLGDSYSDPNFPCTATDILYNQYSVFKLEENLLYRPVSPKIKEHGFVEFYFKKPEAKEIYLMGTFNNFAPRDWKLEPVGNGIWYGKFKIYPGKHYYLFNVDGNRLLDISSPVIRTRSGQKFSVLEMPEYE